jgi:hypothetical protein
LHLRVWVVLVKVTVPLCEQSTIIAVFKIYYPGKADGFIVKWLKVVDDQCLSSSIKVRGPALIKSTANIGPVSAALIVMLSGCRLL